MSAPSPANKGVGLAAGGTPEQDRGANLPPIGREPQTKAYESILDARGPGGGPGGNPFAALPSEQAAPDANQDAAAQLLAAGGPKGVRRGGNGNQGTVGMHARSGAPGAYSPGAVLAPGDACEPTVDQLRKVDREHAGDSSTIEQAMAAGAPVTSGRAVQPGYDVSQMAARTPVNDTSEAHPRDPSLDRPGPGRDTLRP